MWLIISAICILVTILEMFSRAQFFTKTEGCRNFFLRPVAGLTNRGHVRDFRAGTPLSSVLFFCLVAYTIGIWLVICTMSHYRFLEPLTHTPSIYLQVILNSNSILGFCNRDPSPHSLVLLLCWSFTYSIPIHSCWSSWSHPTLPFCQSGFYQQQCYQL